MIGPIFQRETATLPRRGRHFVNRVVFAMMLFAILCTTWLLLAGIQPVQNAGDLARFGVLIFDRFAFRRCPSWFYRGQSRKGQTNFTAVANDLAQQRGSRAW